MSRSIQLVVTHMCATPLPTWYLSTTVAQRTWIPIAFARELNAYPGRTLEMVRFISAEARQSGDDSHVVRELWFDCLALTLVSTVAAYFAHPFAADAKHENIIPSGCFTNRHSSAEQSEESTSTHTPSLPETAAKFCPRPGSAPGASFPAGDTGACTAARPRWRWSG